MGLEGTGGGGDSRELLSAPGLAQKMEDEGTNEENANVLNLFLNSVALPGGAPAPITNNVGSVDVTSASVVFNLNFSRERYGRAAVQEPVTLESDRRSLLLDDNQTNVQKAQSILGALEFANGLSAVQSMSNSDVTGTTAPANIDSFGRRPDTMYINTARLNVTKREHLIPSFTGAAEPEYVAAMVAEAGATSGPTTFSAVVSDDALMAGIAANELASTMLVFHPNGPPQLANSQTAVQEVLASQTALQEVLASQTALAEMGASQTAVQEVETAPPATIHEFATSQTFMQGPGALDTQSPMTRYLFNDDSDTTTVIGDPGDNGTLSGMSYVSGSEGKAISMDSEDSVATIPSSGMPKGEEMSLIVYINMDNTADGFGTNIGMLDTVNEDPNDHGININNTSQPDELNFIVGGPDGRNELRMELPDAELEGTFGQIAATYGKDSNGDFVQNIYLNGSGTEVQLGPGFYGAPTADLRLTGTKNVFTGDYDRLKIYPKRLTQNEVQNELDTGSIS